MIEFRGCFQVGKCSRNNPDIDSVEQAPQASDDQKKAVIKNPLAVEHRGTARYRLRRHKGICTWWSSDSKNTPWRVELGKGIRIVTVRRDSCEGPQQS